MADRQQPVEQRPLVQADEPPPQGPGQMQMQGGLGRLLAGLRALRAADGAAGGHSRLQLTVTQQPAPPLPTAAGGAPGGAQETAAAEAAAAAAAGQEVEEEQGPLAGRRSSSGVPSGGPASPRAAVGALQGAGTADDEAEGVAAAAEQHRLTNTSLTSLDIRTLAAALERGLPHAALLTLLFISQHVVGLAVLAYLTYVLLRVNRLIRGEVARKQARRRGRLLGAAAVLSAHVLAACVALRSSDLAGNMVLMGGVQPKQLVPVLLAVALTDCCLRHLTALAKVAVLLAVQPVDSPARLRRRGHLLTAVEHGAGLYRMLPPTPLWVGFYAQASVGSILQTGLAGAYLLVKAQQVVERARLGAAATLALLTPAGQPPSAEEAQEAGGVCPICQDAYRAPIKLACTHIFCSDCCGEWFERERTCPVCRAAVGPPAARRFRSAGDGATPLWPTIF